MKITKQTPTTLIIECNLSLFSDFIFMLFGTILFTIIFIKPLSSFILDYEFKALECKRIDTTQVGCNLTSVNWLGLGTKRRTFIPAVQGAKAIKTTGTTEEVVLVTSVDKAITIWTSTAKDATAARINSFIKDQSQTTLTIQLTNIFDTNVILPFLILSFLLLCLMISWLSWLRSKKPFMWVFDKKSRSLHVTFKNVIGESETKRYRLQDIQSAEVIREESTDSDGDTTISYETRLNMRSSEPIHLSSSNDRKIAEAINRFLGKPDNPI